MFHFSARPTPAAVHGPSLVLPASGPGRPRAVRAERLRRGRSPRRSVGGDSRDGPRPPGHPRGSRSAAIGTRPSRRRSRARGALPDPAASPRGARRDAQRVRDGRQLRRPPRAAPVLRGLGHVRRSRGVPAGRVVRDASEGARRRGVRRHSWRGHEPDDARRHRTHHRRRTRVLRPAARTRGGRRRGPDRRTQTDELRPRDERERAPRKPKPRGNPAHAVLFPAHRGQELAGYLPELHAGRAGDFSVGSAGERQRDGRVWQEDCALPRRGEVRLSRVRPAGARHLAAIPRFRGPRRPAGGLSPRVLRPAEARQDPDVQQRRGLCHASDAAAGRVPATARVSPRAASLEGAPRVSHGAEPGG